MPLAVDRWLNTEGKSEEEQRMMSAADVIDQEAKKLPDRLGLKGLEPGRYRDPYCY
jgi:hypothetical protein